MFDVDYAKSWKGKKIKVRVVEDDEPCEGDETWPPDGLRLWGVYDAIHDGVGEVENIMFTELVDDFGSKWSGQLDGNCGFKLLLPAIHKTKGA